MQQIDSTEEFEMNEQQEQAGLFVDSLSSWLIRISTGSTCKVKTLCKLLNYSFFKECTSKDIVSV